MQEQDAQAAVLIRDLRFSWQRNSLKRFSRQHVRSQKKPSWSLEIPNLRIERGEHVFVEGPSGSGKSTLLGLIAGVTPVKHGQLWVAGQALHAMQARKRDHFRANHLGFVFQQLNLIPYLSVIDNIVLPVRFAGKLVAQFKPRASQLAERLGIPVALHAQAASCLSVGQQQRVAIARALIEKPALLIADEPTSALDTANRDGFIQLMLEEASRDASTVIFVSHDHGLQRHFHRTIQLTSSAQGATCF